MVKGERIARVENWASGGETRSASVGFTNRHADSEPPIGIDFPLRLEFHPGTTLSQVEEIVSLLDWHLRHIRSIRQASPASGDPCDVGPGDVRSSLRIKQLEMLCRDKDREIAALIEQRRDQIRLMEKLIALLPDNSPKHAVPLRIRVASMLPSSLVRTLREIGWLRRLVRRLP